MRAGRFRRLPVGGATAACSASSRWMTCSWWWPRSWVDRPAAQARGAASAAGPADVSAPAARLATQVLHPLPPRETAAPDSSSAVTGGRASRQRGRATAKAFPGADEVKAPGFAPRIRNLPTPLAGFGDSATATREGGPPFTVAVPSVLSIRESVKSRDGLPRRCCAEFLLGPPRLPIFRAEGSLSGHWHSRHTLLPCTAFG